MCCGYYSRFKVESFGLRDGKSVMGSGFDTEKFYSKRYSRIWPFFALLVMIDVYRLANGTGFQPAVGASLLSVTKSDFQPPMVTVTQSRGFQPQIH